MQTAGYGRMALVFLMLGVGVALICTATSAYAQWSKEQLQRLYGRLREVLQDKTQRW